MSKQLGGSLQLLAVCCYPVIMKLLLKNAPQFSNFFVSKYCHLKIIACNTGVQLFPLQKPSQIYRVFICIAPQPY